MKRPIFMRMAAPLCCATLLLTACQSTYNVTSVTGRRILIDSTWDAHPDPEAVALLAPFKDKVDSVMHMALGEAAETMDRDRPEGPLSNLVADILRQSATEVLGRPADVALMNVGGLRNVLTQGTISYGTAFEILPFDNSLCVLTIQGSALIQVFEDVARIKGCGLSGATMTITDEYRPKEVRVAGKPIDPEKRYTIATIDYLADGNDGLGALIQAEQRECPPGRTLRDLFIEYVQRETAAGRALKAPAPGRIKADYPIEPQK